MAANINSSVSAHLLTLPREQKYIPNVTGKPYKRSDITENTMIRHCDSIGNRPRKVSINFLRVMLKQLSSQIDATTEQYTKSRLATRKTHLYAAIKGFQHCYASGDIQAESARKYCRLHSIVLPDEREITRKASADGIMESIGNSSTSGIRITHNLKGSDFNGARFAPNGMITGMIPLKADTRKDVSISESVGRAKTVQLFDERMGKIVKAEVELADVPKVVRWASDTKYNLGRNTFIDATTGKAVVIPNPKRIKDKVVR